MGRGEVPGPGPWSWSLVPGPGPWPLVLVPGPWSWSWSLALVLELEFDWSRESFLSGGRGGVKMVRDLKEATLFHGGGEGSPARG